MKNRRSFIRDAGLLSSATFVAPALFSCNSNKSLSKDWTRQKVATSKKMIGIQLYTLKDLFVKDPKSVIMRVADAGYKKVETYSYTKQEGFSGHTPKAFKELLKAHDLISTSGMYDFKPYFDSGNKEVIDLYIEAAQTVGQEYITVPYLEPARRNSLDSYKYIAESLTKAAEQCRKADLKLAYHNHHFEFKMLGEETGYDVLLSETDPDIVKMELDIYWICRAGKDPIELMQENPGRHVMWHVKDMDKKNHELNTEIGTGTIDYQTIFKKAFSNIEHIFVEQENFSKDPYESIRESGNYIKLHLIK